MTTTHTVTSTDGTRIAYRRHGTGPGLILIGGALRSPVITEELADLLAADFTVVTFDRRGRGDSGDVQPYAVDREVEDLAALIELAGGTAALYGHSAGAGLALYAAARGLPVTGLVLHDGAFAPDDAARDQAATESAAHRALLAEGRRADSLKRFLTGLGLPGEIVDPMLDDEELVAMAHTIGYDHEVLADARGGRASFAAEAATVTVPALVLASQSAPEWMTRAGVPIAAAFPDGHRDTVATRGMMVAAGDLAPVVSRFLKGE